MLEADEAGPAAVVSRRAADRLRAGHLWVYRSEVEALIPALGHVAVAPGSLVTVLDTRRIPLGSAQFSSSSEITLRLISTEARVSRGEFLDTVRSRLQQAVHLRHRMFSNGVPGGLANGSGEQRASDSLRLVFGEADLLPGILIDRYNDLAVVQLLTQSTAKDDVRAVVREVLEQQGELRLAVERPDPRISQLEQLAAPADPVLFARAGGSQQTIFHLNGLAFGYNAASGQKTGAFLDQRLNYAAARDTVEQLGATRRALDVCTYQGGFALHLAEVCQRVTGVDQSRAALEVAETNLEGNRAKLAGEVDWLEADAFELLRAWDDAGERFSAIVLDPPAFAKSKRAAEGALRGYKELNLRALRMLQPGGVLVTCSCSHHISLEAFTATVAAAGADAHRHVQLLSTRAAAPDHPEVLTLPETRYLKCLIVTV